MGNILLGIFHRKYYGRDFPLESFWQGFFRGNILVGIFHGEYFGRGFPQGLSGQGFFQANYEVSGVFSLGSAC